MNRIWFKLGVGTLMAGAVINHTANDIGTRPTPTAPLQLTAAEKKDREWRGDVVSVLVIAGSVVTIASLVCSGKPTPQQEEPCTSAEPS